MRDLRLHSYRYWNKYVLINACILITILTCSYFMYNDYFHVWLREYLHPSGIVHPGYQEDYLLLTLKSLLTWEYFVSYSMFNMPLFFPLFSVLPCIPFTVELRSLFIFGKHRFASLKKRYYRVILQYASVAAICVTLSMALVFTIGGFFLDSTVNSLGSIDSWLPSNSYSDYPYFVMLFMIFGYYGPMIFAYALLTLSFTFWTRRVYLLPLFVYVLFVAETKLSYYFDSALLDIERNIVAYNILTPLWQMYGSFIIVAFLAFIVMHFGIKKACKEHII